MGYSARPQGGGTAPIVVQACVRKPGSGHVVLTGHPEPPGAKVRAAVHEARVWLGLVERSVAALLGRGDAPELRGGGALPGGDQDLHVHLAGGWDGEDTSLLGGAIAVALVSLRLRCWPRADVAVLGAFSAAGKYRRCPWGHSLGGIRDPTRRLMLGLMLALGALTGHLLPCEKLVPQHMGALSAQGFKALLITDAQRMLSEQVRRGVPSTHPGQGRPGHLAYGVLKGC